MKESKFIELLNLYVDQQIEPEDAALLEAEILRNPARRQVYQQYCRMQRACAALVEQARPEVKVGEKLADTVAAAEEKVLEFPEGRSTGLRYVYIGGLAAACFAAMVVVGRNLKRPANAPATAVEQIVQITPNALQKDAAAAGRINYQPVLVTHSLRLNTTPSATSSAASSEPLSLDWINQVKFTPVSISNEGLALGVQSTLQSSGREAQQRVFHNGLPTQDATQTEQVAYRFQR